MFKCTAEFLGVYGNVATCTFTKMVQYKPVKVVMSRTSLGMLGSRRLRATTSPPSVIRNLGEGFDTLLTVTCKFSKPTLLIPGTSTWSAAEWVDVFLAAVMGHDWGIPLAIISDRDSKFMSEFWTQLFLNLKIKMLTSTSTNRWTVGTHKPNRRDRASILFECTP